MKYRTFEELPVWQSAIDLAVEIHGLARRGALPSLSGLRDQIERAALSVSNNIAEGFERGTHEELIAFLYIAKGSMGEVRSMLRLVSRLPEGAVYDKEFERLIKQSLDITRQLNGWLASLKDGNQAGPRHKNSETRRIAEAEGRRLAFLDTLRQVQEDARRPREALTLPADGAP